MRLLTIVSFAILSSIGIENAIALDGENIKKLLSKPSNPADADHQAERLLSLLTADERFDLVRGEGFAIRGIPRIGIPQLKLYDATAGVKFRKADSPDLKSTAFPAPLLLAASWNTELTEQYGRSVGEQCRAVGAHFLLGPGVNIYRVSVNGRNFEYLGEDPYLASKIAAAYVQGIQSQGVAATIKHFVCNNHETNRRSSNAVVDERTLREIYLPAFQAGVDAGVFSVMTAYNQVNGEWMSQNRSLVTDLLRTQMKFDGLIMTDWTSTWDGGAIAASGVDLEMPLGEALQAGRSALLGSKEVDRMAKSILKTGIASGLYELVSNDQFLKPELLAKFPEHVEFARAVNHEGIVLLKNDAFLPLDPVKERTILVSGNNAERLALAGGGAAHVPGYDLQSYAEAVKAEFSTSVVTVKQSPSDDEIEDAALILLFVGYPEKGAGAEAEKHDRSFELPDEQLIQKCSALNRNTIVCLTCGGGVAMGWKKNSRAILHAFYGGQSGAPALMDVLTGRANPSGKLPFTNEMKFEDSPGRDYLRNPPNAHSYGYDLMNDRLALSKDPDGRGYRTFDVPYKEGIFVGYRWYDAKGIEPAFPFGHGLSYTKFAFSGLTAKVEEKKIKVEFALANIGARDGKEVAQLYVGEDEPTVQRPPAELKGFKKVFLKAGARTKVVIDIPVKELSYWDVNSRSWRLNPGQYTIRVGSSSRDLPLRATVRL